MHIQICAQTYIHIAAEGQRGLSQHPNPTTLEERLSYPWDSLEALHWAPLTCGTHFLFPCLMCSTPSLGPSSSALSQGPHLPPLLNSTPLWLGVGLMSLCSPHCSNGYLLSLSTPPFFYLLTEIISLDFYSSRKLVGSQKEY